MNAFHQSPKLRIPVIAIAVVPCAFVEAMAELVQERRAAGARGVHVGERHVDLIASPEDSSEALDAPFAAIVESPDNERVSRSVGALVVTPEDARAEMRMSEVDVELRPDSLLRQEKHLSLVVNRPLRRSFPVGRRPKAIREIATGDRHHHPNPSHEERLAHSL